MPFYLLVENANFRLRNNKAMSLPENTTPVLDPMFQWQITQSKGYEKENGYYYQSQKPFFSTKGPQRSDYNADVIKELGVRSGHHSQCICQSPFHLIVLPNKSLE